MSISSADRRFLVSGLTSAENMVLARKLSEHADRLVVAMGTPLPMRRDQILGVMIQSSAAPDAQILKVQGWDDGQFFQRLVIPAARRFDEEDILESVTWLLLNRYAAEYTTTGQRHGMGATMPDWISAGLAQNLHPAARARNRDWIARELATGRPLTLAQVIKQEKLPSGRWREKAFAAAAVELLFPDGESRVWTAVLKLVGLRQELDAAWLRQNCTALGAQNPETVWSDFLVRKVRTKRAEAWGDRALQLEENLIKTLHFRPRDWVDVIPADVPLDLFARDLIEYRNQPWAFPLAQALSMQVRSLELGASPIFLGVLSAYVSFFEQLATPPADKTSWWKRAKSDSEERRPLNDAVWEVSLNQLWQRAERAHQEFLASHQNRKGYVDSFDRVAGFSADDWSGDLPPTPRTPIQKFVDEFEDRREQRRNTLP